MDNFWEFKDWENNDKHLKKIKSMPFQRKFPFIPKKQGLYIIRGPRQIGKSSWLKFILSHYCRNEPCYYLSCENISDNKELSEILKSLRNKKVILLDEITFVKDWDRAIKHEVDSGHTNILVITGSHMHDLKLGADRMPGRFYEGGEFFLLPMNFDEFEKMRKAANWSSKTRLEELKAYFKIGGFPDAINEAGPSNQTPQKTISTYLKWLTGDIVKLGKNETYLKELLIQLAISMQTPISNQSLAKKTNIGSHNTISEYISILESCFALKTLFAIDPEKGSLRFKKDKKFYFTDPLIYNMALSLSGLKTPKDYESKAAEMAAHEALSRRHPRFGYHSNKNGEIDFILPKTWALEVKWSEIPKNLTKTFKDSIVPKKIVWTYSNFLKEFP